ncbi:hypothetical protein HNY73_016492 [Argiope bruennichi]|uniref:Uncharacterized protein n=1 Tax=Argiope bruennichi TaxID=94029 RepID=A0A8T0EK26_ARGBR|nr:hypothetical protein HNY73_016492 [Argiope bruennichi]
MEKKFEKLKQKMEVQVTKESRESYETPQEFGLAAANHLQNARYMPVVPKDPPTQLKTRQQKPNETLQELATDIEKLSHLAFSDCPTEVRETLAVQYFVDGVRDVEIQKALRMAETKDLKSALVYAIKFEAAQQASRRDRHFIRGAEVKRDEDPLLKVMDTTVRGFPGDEAEVWRGDRQI